MNDISKAHDQLCFFTLEHRDPRFIHQHVVDAFAAQNATARTKPIQLAFALVGLYLHVECGYDGRQVQRAHMMLARERRPWPKFELPAERGAITVIDVAATPAGPTRDRAIDSWCASVWKALEQHRPAIVALLGPYQLPA